MRSVSQFHDHAGVVDDAAVDAVRVRERMPPSALPFVAVDAPALEVVHKGVVKEADVEVEVDHSRTGVGT